MRENKRPRFTTAAVAAVALAMVSSPSWAGAAQAARVTPNARPTVYQFATLDDSSGPGFNQLLGINNEA